MVRSLPLALGALVASASAFSVGLPGAIPAAAAPAVAPVMKGSRLRTNDMVKVISGDDKGKVAKLLMVDTKKGKVVVEGVNVATKHVKPMKEGETGQLLKRERPIHISNVALSDEQPAAAEAAEATAA